MLLLFLASGALALVYQVLWQRQFALLFGSGSAATAVVLGAFFAGLGVGSFWIGRLAPRWSRPLRVYAVLELLIGVGSLAVTPLMDGFGGAYPWLAERLGASPGLFVAVKGLLAFLVLALPTFCMGGTLPVLAQQVDRGPRRLGSTVGGFYVANTVGAAIGALSVPFVLLPAFGGNLTLSLCAAGNLLVAVLAGQLDRRAGDTAIPSSPPASAVPTSGAGARGLAGGTADRSVGWLFAFSGMSGLVLFALQVLWNRAFAQVHENSLHAFAVIATVFILALAVGGQLSRLALARGRTPEGLLGVAWLAGGIGTGVAPWLFLSLTGQLGYLSNGGEWAAEARRLLGLGFAVIFIPVTLLGMGFPALMESAGRRSGIAAGPLLGRLLGVNIAGCVAGALLAGFILPQTLGLWGSLSAAGGIAAAIGAWMLRSTRRSAYGYAVGPARPSALLFASVAALAVLFVYGASTLPRVRLNSRQNERLLSVAEGTHGVVAVTERPGSRRLKLNNHYALGGTLSLGDQRMQSHVPLLLHPDPRRVGHLGLGTGLSAGGILFHPVGSVEVVELVPEVVEAARNHFAEGAAGLFSDARVRLVTADARNFLRSRPEPFDVLIGDLVVPWRQGESALFTAEHFVAARESLRPGGLFCQWLPMFQLSEIEMRILLRTFLSVFPKAYVWRGDFSPDRPALALVGIAESFRLDPHAVRARLAAIRSDPTNPQLGDPAGFWMNFVGVLEPGDLEPGETRRHTEDRPWIELLGPRTHVQGRRSMLFTGRELQRWLVAIRERSRSENRVPALTQSEWSAAGSGELLLEFGLCLLDRNEAEAARLRRRLESQLPPVVARGIFGPPGP